MTKKLVNKTFADVTLREWLRRFEAGEFEDESVRTQFNAGWYDWKCYDTSLVKKTRDVGNKLRQLAESEMIDADNTFVYFQNEEPSEDGARQRDVIRICDIETGNLLFSIVPRSGDLKNLGEAEVWKRLDDRVERIYSGNWRGVRRMFGVASSPPNMA